MKHVMIYFFFFSNECLKCAAGGFFVVLKECVMQLQQVDMNISSLTDLSCVSPGADITAC